MLERACKNNNCLWRGKGVSIWFALLASACAGYPQMPYQPIHDVKVYDSQFDVPAPAEVRNVIQESLNFLCEKDCGETLIVRNPTVIGIRNEQIGTKKSKIIYSSKRLEALTQRYGQQATFGIFAHEVGHHIGSIISPDLVAAPWDRELHADELSGCAIAMAGFTTGQLESAILNEATYPSHSHPSSPLRIKAIRQGYLRCGGDISDFRR
jgi:hypothetical protein